MQALTWQGREHVEVRSVPDPTLVEPNDAQAPARYDMFRRKAEDCLKAVLDPRVAA